MKKWEVDCTDKYSGIAKLICFEAETKKDAAKQAFDQDYIVGDVFDFIETAPDSKTLADNTQSKSLPQTINFQTLGTVGKMLVFAGVASALYISVFMETTVAVDGVEEFAKYLEIDKASNLRVINLKLLNDRLLFGVLSGFVFIAGTCMTSAAILGQSLKETLTAK